MSEKDPVEGKVWASTVGTGTGAVLSAFTVWLLGVLIWHAPRTAAGATEAVAAVPAPVTGIVGLLITVGFSFAGGYWAKHTPRPQPDDDDDLEEQTLIARRDPSDVAAPEPVEA